MGERSRRMSRPHLAGCLGLVGLVGCAEAVAAAGRSRVWVAAWAAYPWVEEEESAEWLGPQRWLEVACAWAVSSRLGPGAGWAAVVLLNLVA